jgi:CheY-like chemotaxis protein/two-component sensor histidine kinase
MLAHELRNPLAPIRSAVHIMQRVGPADPLQESMRATIDRQSAQLVRIVDDMLDIARITRGTLAVERARVDVRDIVHRAVETAAPAIERARHALEIELPSEALDVSGDAARLVQLVGNVLNNSARYTPDGGQIRISARREGRFVALRVRDTGRGIEPQAMERIFDMFVQGRPAQLRVGQGLGVGLALARRIAELHGGTLEAHSDGRDKGSVFTLRLPGLDGAQEPAPERRGAPAALAARRVLVVDDNVDAAETLDLLLRSLGHETRVAFEGPEALKIAAEFRPDVVLLDIGMPGMDGYEVARHLRPLKRERAFRVVAVTGWGNAADREKSREAGFDLHLVKPVSEEELSRALSPGNGPTVH